MRAVARLLDQSNLAWVGLKSMNMSNLATQLGQSLLRASSVFNFYRPGYVPPGSKVVEAGLVARKLQIATNASVPGLPNHMQGFMSGVSPRTARGIDLDHRCQAWASAVNSQSRDHAQRWPGWLPGRASRPTCLGSGTTS